MLLSYSLHTHAHACAQIDRRMDVCTYVPIHVEGWMDGWMDGWTCVCTYMPMDP